MKRTILFASLLCVLISIPALAVNGNMGGGNGSESTPYLIEDLADFDTFADPNNAATYWAAGVHTQLMTDIDLAGRTYSTAVIAPDSTPDDSFFTGTTYSGSFDGNEHIINNLFVGNGYYYIGLFGKISNQGIVNNLSLENTVINAVGQYHRYAGSLCGFNDSGIIIDCYSSGSISGYYSVGGLIGVNLYDGTVTNCHSCCNVNGYWYVGGLMGNNGSTGLSNCYSTGNISGVKYVGGLAGYNLSNSIIAGCYSTGDVSGDQSIGGLVGTTYGLVTNCYSSGSVHGNSRVGGLVGESENDGFIEYSYSIGSVNGNTYVGGLGGWIDLGMWRCFWDVETSGIGNPGDEDSFAIGKSTTQMQTLETFTDAAWDFDPNDGDPADWMMLRPGEDYPRLAWQEVFDGDIAGLYGVDLVDFAYLANYWQLTGCNSGTDCGRADIDGSGDVGLADLVYVSEDWLKE